MSTLIGYRFTLRRYNQKLTEHIAMGQNLEWDTGPNLGPIHEVTGFTAEPIYQDKSVLDLERLTRALYHLDPQSLLFGSGPMSEVAAELAAAYEEEAPQTSPQSDPTALDAWQASAESRRRE